MNAEALLREGRLADAIQSLGAVLRSDPTNVRRRIFLFELLCFAGDYDRAEKQLDILAQEGREAALGTLRYRGAIHAERTRQQMFELGEFPRRPAPAPIRGTLNGRAFRTLEDADPRIGPRLEVFAAGGYLWLPLAHVASVRISPPSRLRDLLWIPAIVRAGPELRDLELGDVLLPALTPRAWQHEDDAVRLGRVTEWAEYEDGQAAPMGQKLLLVDDEEMPILEWRELDIAQPAGATG